MNKRNYFSLLVLWYVLLAGGSVLTAGSVRGQQQQAIITVTDNKSKEPVAFAHVCFEGIDHKSTKYSLTSIDGIVPNTVTEPSRIVISYVGYTTYNDTIKPGESLKINLKPSILSMDEVVVTAQYSPERADKSIYRVEVINKLQIESKAATNMADLLKDESTMRVQQNGVLGTSLKMQGLSGENIKFLMDGVPMIGRMNGNFDLNQLNLYNVDHVEVIEGPMSVIYGSNALAGVVNIITKENTNGVLSTSVNGYYESVGQYNFDGSITANYKNHGFSVNGGRNFFGGYSYSDTTRRQTFKPREQYFFDGYYSYRMKNFKLKISGDYFNEFLLDKGVLLPAYYETAFDNHFNTIRYSGRGDISFNLPKRHFINAVASYSVYNRIKKTYYVDLTDHSEVEVATEGSTDTTNISSLLLRAAYAKNNSEQKFNYQTGIDFNSEQGEGRRIAGNKQEIGDYAAFLSLTWDPVKILSVQPGLRVIYNTKYDAPLVYALSMKLNPLSGTNIRFSYARGFRAPDIKQLYLTFVDVNHDIKGNPDLKAERSHNVNLNLNYSKERKSVAYTFDATGFYNKIENVIILANTGSSATSYTYINLDKYETTGFQAMGTVNLYPSVKLQAGLSTTGIKGTLSDSVKNDFIFSNDITLNGSYRFVKQELTFSVYYKYSGKAPNFLIQDDVVSIYYIDPYNTMDFTATKGFWMNRIRLSGGVKNIFDVKAVPTTGAVGGGHSSGSDAGNIGWGRTVFLKLSFTFNKYK